MMNQKEITELFDEQASYYDDQWRNLTVLKEGLHFLLRTYMTSLPKNANILCVGVGTGQELIYLAKYFADWHFTAVEPAGKMIEECKIRAREQGVFERCHFHHGYLDTLTSESKFDAATSILVSHFLMNNQERIVFFKQISQRLKPNGILMNADLTADTLHPGYPDLLGNWLKMMIEAGLPANKIEDMKEAYQKDVSLLPSSQLIDLIESAGFIKAFPFYQSGVIQAQMARVA